jgi:hypothetical protein
MSIDIEHKVIFDGSGDLHLSGVLPAREASLKSGVYLVMLNPHLGPPHLYLLVEGGLFSLSVSGVKMNQALGPFLQWLLRTGKGAMFVELFLPEIFQMRDVHDKIREIFAAYPEAGAPGITCLSPIRDFCSEIIHPETAQSRLIFDLLPCLERVSGIGSVSQINLGSYLYSDTFRLKKYSLETVFSSMENG